MLLKLSNLTLQNLFLMIDKKNDDLGNLEGGSTLAWEKVLPKLYLSACIST